MASDADRESAERTDDPCMACRGTGQVIAVVDEETRSVECPWCKGSGRRIPRIDAQERWAGKSGAGEERDDEPPGDAGAGGSEDEPPPAA